MALAGSSKKDVSVNYEANVHKIESVKRNKEKEVFKNTTGIEARKNKRKNDYRMGN